MVDNELVCVPLGENSSKSERPTNGLTCWQLAIGTELLLTDLQSSLVAILGVGHLGQHR